MQSYKVYKIFTVAGMLFIGQSIQQARAQNGTGSSLLSTNLYIESSTSVNNFEETIYIGPGTHTINGTWNLYSKNIWIHPAAEITGTGQIIILNPDDNESYPDMSGTTTIDHNNGLPLNVNIVHLNPNNVILSDITDPEYGTTNPTGALAAALNIDNDFNFGINGGDVILNGNDMTFSSDATVSGYSNTRMVVTDNSTNGHVVKFNTASTSFVFPVGIAEGDYTPVTLVGPNDYYVSVINYSVGPRASLNRGINRTWHIYGGIASSVTLQHNLTTDGINYMDASAFITKYEGSGVWSIGVLGVEFVSAGVLTSSSIGLTIPSSSTADGSFFSKSSDDNNSLPISLQDFNAFKIGEKTRLLWATASEKNTLGFNVERSVDGANWETLGFVASKAENGTSQHRLEYLYYDLKPQNGTNLYRLKQKDKDGTFAYSIIRNLDFDVTDRITIYPNPVVNSIHVTGLKGMEYIVLFDVLGNEILSNQMSGSSEVSVSVNALVSGTYFIKIIDEGIILHTQKIQVLR